MISWVILTYNRAEAVKRSFEHNKANAGAPIDELIWVDNGSTDGVKDFMLSQNPDVAILNKTNLGVAKGYNRGFAMATGDYIVITGCDMLMPDNWLATFKKYLEAIPETGVACMYSVPLTECRERIRGDRQEINGLPIVPALPFGRRCFRKDLLKTVGYLREDFGLYGWEDNEWGERCLRKCTRPMYVIPDQVAEHLGTEGIKPHNGLDPADYHAFKQAEVKDPKKQERLKWCSANDYPFYTPY